MLRATTRAEAAGGERVEGLAASAAPEIADGGGLAAGGAAQLRTADGLLTFALLEELGLPESQEALRDGEDADQNQPEIPTAEGEDQTGDAKDCHDAEDGGGLEAADRADDE